MAPGDVVATLLPNIPAQAEAHFGVPACGAVLNTINTRLDVDTVAYIFGHGGAKVVLVDTPVPRPGRSRDGRDGGRRPRHHRSARTPQAGYPAIRAPPGPTRSCWRAAIQPSTGSCREDEWESLALNYTSGTTGRPKGVVYHHRGAYLMTMGTVVELAAWCCIRPT